MKRLTTSMLQATAGSSTDGTCRGCRAALDIAAAGRERRRFLQATAAGAGIALSALTGCASRSPSVRWYALRNDPPPGVAASPAAAPVAGNGARNAAATNAAATNAAATVAANDIWEVSRSVRLPSSLDRDALMLQTGAAGLQPLDGHRWAEPLRDSASRLLLHDLALLRGPGRIWAAPAPAGVAVARRLSVELLALQGSADRRTLRLQAQWWLQEVQAGGAAPVQGRADFSVDLAEESVDALAAAHRVALWRLAEQVAT